MERQCRDREPARRFDDEPAALRSQAHGRRDLGLADGHDRVQVRSEMGERPGTQCLGPRPVRDGPRHELRRPGHDLAALERIARVGRQLRFDADHPGFRPQLVDRDGHPARQPTATDRDEDRGQIRQVLCNFQPDGPLSGDDPVVVERRDDREASPRGDLLGDALAFVARGPDDDDLGAIERHALALDRGGIGRHHDDRRRSEQPRGPRDALGVVARGVRDDATRERLRSQGRDRRVGATELERADRLERLGLEEVPVRGRPEPDERRPDGDPPQALGRGPDVGQGDERGDGLGLGLRRHQRSRAARRWQSIQRAAHGNASRRSRAIGRPQRTHVPNVPASTRVSASSTSTSCWSDRSRRARSRCWAKTWLAAAACDP